MQTALFWVEMTDGWNDMTVRYAVLKKLGWKEVDASHKPLNCLISK